MNINFAKQTDYETGEKLFFRYEGESPSVDVTEKVTDDIKIFLNDSTSHGDMYRNITYLRTILKDCKESLFVISYMDILGNHQIVKYKDKRLITYKNSKKIKDTKYVVESNGTAGLQISFCNVDDDFTDYKNSKKINEQVSDTLKTISVLKNIRKVDINEDAKKLINIYKLFYGENPDFSYIDIYVRVQSMMNILESFGVSLGNNYEYNIYGGKDYPMSMTLETLISTLRPLGRIVSVDDVGLSDKDKKIIECISASIKDVTDSEVGLITLSKVISMDREYGDNFDIPIEDDADKEQITSTVQKIKSMKERVSKEII